MPYTINGIIPDLIVNNAAFPTRMVINQPKEMVKSQISLHNGQLYDGTAFRPFSVEKLKEDLENIGLKSNGTHRTFDGMTGEWIDTEVFIGPTYYQRLQKFIKDNTYAINRGAINIKTGQPVQGASSGGSYKLGEMEQANVFGQGGGRTMIEKFLTHSDGYTWYLCKNCGERAIVNIQANIWKCKNCNDMADITAVETAWSAKLFADHLESSNIHMKYELNPYTFTERK